MVVARPSESQALAATIRNTGGFAIASTDSTRTVAVNLKDFAEISASGSHRLRNERVGGDKGAKTEEENRQEKKHSSFR